MKLLTFVTKGKARIVGDALRCASLRSDDERKICNKLLVKRNAQGQIAGNFKCERCRQEVEVKLAPPREDLR
jgi:hypothetical protein